MKPVTSGYADINNIRLYREIHGQGEPMVLIHGGLTTIGEMQGWLQPLAKTRRVIAVEMQGQRNCTSLGHIHATPRVRQNKIRAGANVEFSRESKSGCHSRRWNFTHEPDHRGYLPPFAPSRFC